MGYRVFQREQFMHSLLPLSITQWLRSIIGLTATHYPRSCSLCGRKTRGNRLTGFYMPCEPLHDREVNHGK
jgi:hypothetical protein